MPLSETKNPDALWAELTACERIAVCEDLAEHEGPDVVARLSRLVTRHHQSGFHLGVVRGHSPEKPAQTTVLAGARQAVPMNVEDGGDGSYDAAADGNTTSAEYQDVATRSQSEPGKAELFDDSFAVLNRTPKNSTFDTDASWSVLTNNDQVSAGRAGLYSENTVAVYGPNSPIYFPRSPTESRSLFDHPPAIQSMAKSGYDSKSELPIDHHSAMALEMRPSSTTNDALAALTGGEKHRTQSTEEATHCKWRRRIRKSKRTNKAWSKAFSDRSPGPKPSATNRTTFVSHGSASYLSSPSRGWSTWSH